MNRFNLSILIIPKLRGKLFYNEGNKVKSTFIEKWYWSFFDFFSFNIIIYQTIIIFNAALFHVYVTSSIIVWYRCNNAKIDLKESISLHLIWRQLCFNIISDF